MVLLLGKLKELLLCDDPDRKGILVESDIIRIKV